MAYTWIEHTAEAEVAIEAQTEQEVFADALEALSELISTGGTDTQQTREVGAEACDRATMLASFLDELVFLAERDGFVAERLSCIQLGEKRLKATVVGRRGELRWLVKAVTYHRLRFEARDDGFVANVVLDV